MTENILENYFYSDPNLKSDIDTSYLSHKDKYEEAARRVGLVIEKLKQLDQGQYGEDVFQ